eukprot:COSAG03_NODE_4146_length_1664_cov_1.690735_3_plen_227_part_01
MRRYDPELLVICCADEGWLPSASYLVDDRPGRSAAPPQMPRATAEDGGRAGWENSEPASRTWLPILAELTAGFRETPTLALLGTPHPCNSKAPRGKTGVASMLAQIFVVGGAAAQRILPSQNKRQKVAESAPEKRRVERIVGKRALLGDEPSGDPGSAARSASTAGGASADKAGEAGAVNQVSHDTAMQTEREEEYLVKWHGLGDANATWEPAPVSLSLSLSLSLSP